MKYYESKEHDVKYYEFVPGDTIEIAPGRTLKRIRAVAEIAALGVTPGQLGGYIEHEKNLFGNAWVSDDAWIAGNAQISGNARVGGNAWIYGDARVGGDAWISGNAWISSDAKVGGNAMINGDGLIFWASKVGSENGTLTVYNTKSHGLEVTRGCFRGSVEEFLAASKAKHDGDTHLEYRLLIEVATSRITRARERLPQIYSACGIIHT